MNLGEEAVPPGGVDEPKAAGPRMAAEVIEAELKLIRCWRKRAYESITDYPKAHEEAEDGLSQVDLDRRLTKARLDSLEEHLVGMSFSAGGIRSGTYVVGFLQGLARLGLLRRFDYLSTVSGGGYAGSWLAAWLKREGDVRNVELQLNPNRVAQAGADRSLLPPYQDRAGRSRVVDEEPSPVHHLRRFSSYLFPRFGFLTADTWTVIAIWLRNVSINMLMLLPLAMILVLLSRAVIYFSHYISPTSIAGDVSFWLPLALFLIGALLLIFGFVYNAYALGEFRAQAPGGRIYGRGSPSKRPRFIETRIYRFVLYPLVGAMLLLTIPLRAIIWKLGEG